MKAYLEDGVAGEEMTKLGTEAVRLGIGWVGRGSRAGGRGGCVRMGLHDGGDDSGALGAEGRGHGKGGGGRISSPGRTETVTTQRARGDRSGLTLGRRSD